MAREWSSRVCQGHPSGLEIDKHGKETRELDVEGGLDVGGAVAVEAGGGDGLGEDDADGNEDGAGAGSVGDGDFDTGAFGVLIAAAEAEAAFGEIFADGDFFLEAAAANAGEDASFDARALAAGNDAFVDGGTGGAFLGGANFGLRLDPDGGRLAKFADARDAFANLERSQFELVEIDDLAALAEAAFHEETRNGFLGFVEGGKFDAPEIGARLDQMDGVKEAGGILIDFGDDACARAFPVVAFLMATKVQLLAGGELFGEAEDPTVAADQQGFRGLRDGRAACGHPGSLERHPEADAVTLAEIVGKR
jgi:hypothetical protein